MTCIHKVLKGLMQNHGLSETKVSQYTGVNQGIISRILTRETKNPRIETLIPIAEFFKISLDQLVGRTPQDLDRRKVNTGTSLLPFIDWGDVYQWRDIQKQADKIPVTIKPSSHIFATTMNNQSMEPMIMQGCQMIIDTSINPIDGDHVIAYHPHDNIVLVRRLIDDGKKKLVCLNQNYSDYDMNENWSIIGTIIQISIDYHQ